MFFVPASNEMECSALDHSFVMQDDGRVTNRVEIKICGLTNEEDAAHAVHMGADYLGFIFARQSPRHVEIATVREILRYLPETVRAVGVFVNASPDEVRKAVAVCGLKIVQLHGDERPDDFSGFDVPVWRTIWCCDRDVRPRPQEWEAQRYLVDAAVPGKYGGTGEIADWAAAAALAARYEIVLAGGLTPDNVAEAIQRVRPVAVDVVSGVEATPGRKDHDKVAAFISAVRSVGATGETE